MTLNICIQNTRYVTSTKIKTKKNRYVVPVIPFQTVGENLSTKINNLRQNSAVGTESITSNICGTWHSRGNDCR